MSGGKLTSLFVQLFFYALFAFGAISMYRLISENILANFRHIYSMDGDELLEYSSFGNDAITTQVSGYK